MSNNCGCCDVFGVRAKLVARLLGPFGRRSSAPRHHAACPKSDQRGTTEWDVDPLITFEIKTSVDARHGVVGR